MPRTRLLTLTLAVAVALAGCGGGDDHGGGGSPPAGGGVSTKPISLPESLPGFGDMVQQNKKKGANSAAVANQVKHQKFVEQQTVAQYSKAYGGAAVAYHQYADDQLLLLPWVIAVRAQAPGLTLGPVVDAKYLLAAKPDHEVVSSGDVECAVNWEPTPSGKPVPPDSQDTQMCQRTSKGLSVFVGGPGEFKGPQGFQKLVDLTNAAYDAVSG